MPPVPAALYCLLAHFGTSRVAEVTGRSRRIVIGSDGSQKLERRGARANLSQTPAFMDGMKPFLVFSDAGGPGRSYPDRKSTRLHASPHCASQMPTSASKKNTRISYTSICTQT